MIYGVRPRILLTNRLKNLRIPSISPLAAPPPSNLPAGAFPGGFKVAHADDLVVLVQEEIALAKWRRRNGWLEVVEDEVNVQQEEEEEEATATARRWTPQGLMLLLDIAVVAAAALVANANGSLASVHAQLARVSRAFRSALSAPATRLRIFTLASPFPDGDIASFVRPGWPEGLTREEREDLLLCWLDDRLARCSKGEIEIAEVFRPSFGWTRRNGELTASRSFHLLDIAAADNHLRLVQRLLALGDSPTFFTHDETLLGDNDEVLRLLAAKSPPYFSTNAKASILATAASLCSFKCVRVLFGFLPRDRFADLVFGAVRRACAELNVNGLDALCDLEAELRPAGTFSAFDAPGEEAERVRNHWLSEVRVAFLLKAEPSNFGNALEEFVACVKLLVSSLGVSPSLALRVVSDMAHHVASDVESRELLRWLIANGGRVDELPEQTRSVVPRLLQKTALYMDVPSSFGDGAHSPRRPAVASERQVEGSYNASASPTRDQAHQYLHIEYLGGGVSGFATSDNATLCTAGATSRPRCTTFRSRGQIASEPVSGWSLKVCGGVPVPSARFV
ncbi:hypothetical protein DFJ73DRAFT_796433 [Zopfochytrium polystomum]|nr:hypothetical protein DFJ73DRAFT_796433 [Zopfochytrium polystomum]